MSIKKLGICPECGKLRFTSKSGVLKPCMYCMKNVNSERIYKACIQYGYHAGCIVPGCKRLPRLHHFVPRREGGTEGIANKIAICAFHETPLHKAGAYARKHFHL